GCSCCAPTATSSSKGASTAPSEPPPGSGAPAKPALERRDSDPRLTFQADDGRAPPSPLRRSIRARGDERVVREQRLDDPALDADPSPVDQPHLGETARVGGLEVLGDDGRNVARGERVQVERVLDRAPDGLLAAY